MRIGASSIEIEVEAGALAALIGGERGEGAPTTIAIACAARLPRTGRAPRLVSEDNARPVTAPDLTLTRLLIQTRRWWAVLAEGELNIDALAAREQVSASYMTRVVRLAFLAPTVVEAMLEGRQKLALAGARLLATDAAPAL